MRLGIRHSLCGFQKKITHVQINGAHICILCIKETNGINADYRVFLRTVHHAGLLGRTGRHGGAAEPWPRLWAASQGAGIFGSLSQGVIQDGLQSQLVFQVFHRTHALKKVKAISIFLRLIPTDQPSASASTPAILCLLFQAWQTRWAHFSPPFVSGADTWPRCCQCGLGLTAGRGWVWFPAQLPLMMRRGASLPTFPSQERSSM